MNSRDDILASVRANLPRVDRPPPIVPMFDDNPPASLLARFKDNLHRMGGVFLDPPGSGDLLAPVKEKIAGAKAVAARRGRKFEYGIRLHVIVRETSQEAWAAAEDLIKHVDDETIAAAQKTFARYDSVGQQRMAKLHSGRRDKLEVSPNLWAGVGLVRGGAGTALVGDPDVVAERMREYAALGIDTFILSGYPHLEEAYRVAELLFPLLPIARPAAATTTNLTGSFGEMLANDIVPRAAAR